MNVDELRFLAAQGRVRFEAIGSRTTDGGVFTIDGALVTGPDDHALCAHVLGMTPTPPSLVPERLLPSPPPVALPPDEPEREPMTGVALPTPETPATPTAPADAAEPVATPEPPEPEED